MNNNIILSKLGFVLSQLDSKTLLNTTLKPAFVRAVQL